MNSLRFLIFFYVSVLICQTNATKFYYTTASPKPTGLPSCTGTQFIDVRNTPACSDSCDGGYFVSSKFEDVSEPLCVSSCGIFRSVYRVEKDQIVASCVDDYLKSDSAETPLCSGGKFRNNVDAEYDCVANCAAADVKLETLRFGKFCLPSGTTSIKGYSRLFGNLADLSAFTFVLTDFHRHLFALYNGLLSTTTIGLAEHTTSVLDSANAKIYLYEHKIAIASACEGTHNTLTEGSRTYCVTDANCNGDYIKEGSTCIKRSAQVTNKIYDFASKTFVDSTVDANVHSKLAGINISAYICKLKSTATEFYYTDGSKNCIKCDNKTFLSSTGLFGCEGGVLADNYYKKSTAEVDYYISYKEYHADYCKNNRLEYGKLYPDPTDTSTSICVSATECVSSLAGRNFVLNEGSESECLATVPATHTYSLTTAGGISAKLTETQCAHLFEYLKFSSSTECVAKSSCITGNTRIIAYTDGVPICHNAATCPAGSPNTFSGSCYDNCPEGTYLDGTTCKVFADCTDKVLIGGTNDPSCSATTDNYYRLSFSDKYFYTEAAAKANNLVVQKLNTETLNSRVAFWPGLCPIQYDDGSGNKSYMYLDSTNKECKQINHCSGASNCLSFSAGTFICKAEAPMTNSILCSDTVDHPTFDSQLTSAILEENCLLSENEYNVTSKECKTFDIANEYPCDAGYFLKIDNNNTTINSLTCVSGASCPTTHSTFAYDRKQAVFCIQDTTNTDAIVTAIKGKFTIIDVNSSTITAGAAKTTSKFFITTCPSSRKQAPLTDGSVYCMAYDKCLADGKVMVFTPASNAYACQTKASVTNPVEISDVTKEIFFVAEANCTAISNHKLQENIWNSNNKVCINSTDEQISVFDSDLLVSKFEAVTAKIGDVLRNEALDTYTKLTSTTGYRLAPSTGFYYEICPTSVNLFPYNDGADRCYAKSDCISQGKYFFPNDCLDFASAKPETGKKLDLDIGYSVTTCAAGKLTITLPLGGAGCVSSEECLNLNYTIDGTECVKTCADFLYTEGTYRECFTQAECIANPRGGVATQRVTKGTTECIKQASCTDFIDFDNFTCTTDCTGKTKVGTTAPKYCFSKCFLNSAGEVEYKNTDGSCATTCTGDIFKVFHTRECATSCPTGTFPTADKFCLSGPACKNKTRNFAAKLGGNCEAFTPAENSFLSTDFIVGDLAACKAGNLFHTVVAGKPVYVSNESTWNWQCIAATQACPTDTFPNAANDGCYSEMAAVKFNEVLNKEGTAFKAACDATEVHIRLEIFNRCVLRTGFKTFADDYKVRYLFVVDTANNGVAVTECNKAGTASEGYFLGTANYQCMNATQCGAEADYLFYAPTGGDKACLHKSACVDTKIELVGSPSTCIDTSTCVSGGNLLFYDTDKRKCSATCGAGFINQNSKCFTEATCSQHGDFIYKENTTTICYSKTECQTASHVTGNDGTINRCFTVAQCSQTNNFSEIKTKQCLSQEGCKAGCVNPDNCIVETREGYCFERFTGRDYTATPQLAFKHGIDVYTDNCFPIRTLVDDSTCIETCDKYTDERGVFCYKTCKYCDLDQATNLPFVCMNIDYLPNNFNYIPPKEFLGRNEECTMLTKTTPNGFKNQYGLLKYCQSQKLFQQKECVAECPRFTFDRGEYCEACNDRGSTRKFLNNTCVDFILEPAVLTDTNVNGYLPCSEVPNGAVQVEADGINSNCVTECYAGYAKLNGTCEKVADFPDYADRNGTLVLKAACTDTVEVCGSKCVDKPTCSPSQIKGCGVCLPCSSDKNRVLFNDTCLSNCPSTTTERYFAVDGTCKTCTEIDPTKVYDSQTDSCVLEKRTTCSTECPSCDTSDPNNVKCVCPGDKGGPNCNLTAEDSNIEAQKFLSNVEIDLNSIATSDPLISPVTDSISLEINLNLDLAETYARPLGSNFDIVTSKIADLKLVSSQKCIDYQRNDISSLTSAQISTFTANSTLVCGLTDSINNFENKVVNSNSNTARRMLQTSNEEVFKTSIRLYLRTLILNEARSQGIYSLSRTTFNIFTYPVPKGDEAITALAAELGSKGFPRLDLGECNSSILDKAQGTAIIGVIEWTEGSKPNTATNNYDWHVLDSKGGLDLTSECNGVDVFFNFPLNKIPEVKDKAEEVLAYVALDNINLYNPDHPFYDDRCYSIAVNGYDQTIHMRREKFPGKKLQCHSSCTLKEITSDFYAVCACFDFAEKQVSLEPYSFTNVYDKQMVGYAFRCNYDFSNGNELHRNAALYFYLGLQIFVLIIFVFLKVFDITEFIIKNYSNEVRKNNFFTAKSITKKTKKPSEMPINASDPEKMVIAENSPQAEINEEAEGREQASFCLK